MACLVCIKEEKIVFGLPQLWSSLCTTYIANYLGDIGRPFIDQDHVVQDVVEATTSSISKRRRMQYNLNISTCMLWKSAGKDISHVN
ncbi:hypothetical protein Y1Q_0010661 [Alligator mississippiensis]|uniref:Uncharacterized protein n=1 Tax=Alligator mississippiensis TaxID=8496 RepID=A0A151M6D4_ALLMI|nr:hypothetical protein Y1Q_0010661 [Alligator mississippiensis]